MADYIEREAAIAYAPLQKHFRKYQTMNLDDAWEDGYDFAIRQIESIPAADVRPVVRGKWLPFGKRGIYGMMYACSSCRAKYDGKTNFCPNCGADMREADNEKA